MLTPRASAPHLVALNIDVSPQAMPWVTDTEILFTLQRMKQTNQDLPGWGEMPKYPGLYLSLSHGRTFPQETMRGRGFPGPKLGPLLYVKTTYGQEVTVRFARRRDVKKHFPATSFPIQTLQIVEGTLVLGEQCFGEWDVCHIAAEFCLQS